MGPPGKKLFDEDWWYYHLEERRRGGAPPDSLLSGVAATSEPEKHALIDCVPRVGGGAYEGGLPMGGPPGCSSSAFPPQGPGVLGFMPIPVIPHMGVVPQLAMGPMGMHAALSGPYAGVGGMPGMPMAMAPPLGMMGCGPMLAAVPPPALLPLGFPGASPALTPRGLMPPAPLALPSSLMMAPPPRPM